MASDGFGTLTSTLLERGTTRVRAVLDERKVDVIDPLSDGEHITAKSERFYRNGSGDAHGDGARQHDGFGHRAAFGRKSGDREKVDGRPEASLASLDKWGAAKPRVTADETGPQPSDGQPADRKPATPNALKAAKIDAGATDAQSPTHDNDDAAPWARDKAVEELPDAKDAETSQRTGQRRASGASLTIVEPETGDMSWVKIAVNDPTGEAYKTGEPGKGQKPTSVTYERRTLAQLAAEAAAIANGEPSKPVWVDTPTYSGPDRRHNEVSPEVERRQSVPARIKAGVRLEQERYLRLKLSAVTLERSQQDIITAALDHYLDDQGVDRFVRTAMEFGLPNGAEDDARDSA